MVIVTGTRRETRGSRKFKITAHQANLFNFSYHTIGFVRQRGKYYIREDSSCGSEGVYTTTRKDSFGSGVLFLFMSFFLRHNSV
jgi:hypothetical protein